MKRILVVDDNHEILDVLKVLLEMKGYEVRVMWDGHEVLDAIKEFSPDVVLLDVFLSGISGIDICKEIKSVEETKESSVILFSAHTTRQEIIDQCSADGFIAKPFDIHDLTETIENEISKSEE